MNLVVNNNSKPFTLYISKIFMKYSCIFPPLHKISDYGDLQFLKSL